MRIALVGCGFVADLYLRTRALHPSLEIAGVFDRDARRLAAFTSHHGLRAYGSLAELLGDASVSLVLNLTNPRSHYEVSRACLEAGKHVYSEKPLAMRFEEAEELVALAAARGLHVSSAPCSLLGEAAQTIWRALREGRIGPVYAVYAEMDDGLIHRQPYRSWLSDSGAAWPYKDEFEIGCTLEHAGYYLTWLPAFFGPATAVTALASTRIADKGAGPLEPNAPDLSVATITFASGVVARLTCSIIAPHDHRLQVFGAEGILGIEDCWFNRAPVSIRRFRNIRRRRVELPWRERVPLAASGRPTVSRKGAAGMDFLLGPAEMAEAIGAGREPRLSAAYSLHVTELALAIHGATGEGVARAVRTSFEPMLPMPWAAEGGGDRGGRLAMSTTSGSGVSAARPAETRPGAGASAGGGGGERVVRWGILGTGNIAAQLARSMRNVAGGEVVAVASRSEERARSFAERFGIGAWHGSYEALVNDPRVEVVYVATPHARHRDDCLLAIGAGKAVLCEKPFTADAAEAREVVEAARAKGVFAMEAMWTRFLPAVQKARELIGSGAIGEPRVLYADFGVPTVFDPENRFFNAALGGGALLDRGVYAVSVAMMLLGRPESVDAAVAMTGTGVDEHSAVTLRFAGGAVGVATSTLTSYGHTGLVVAGTKGRMELHEPLVRPEKLTLSPAPVYDPSADTGSGGGGLKARLRNSPLLRGLKDRLAPRGKVMRLPCDGIGYEYEVREVNRCVRAGERESAVLPLDETVAVMEVLDAVRRVGESER